MSQLHLCYGVELLSLISYYQNNEPLNECFTTDGPYAVFSSREKANQWIKEHKEAIFQKYGLSDKASCLNVFPCMVDSMESDSWKVTITASQKLPKVLSTTGKVIFEKDRVETIHPHAPEEIWVYENNKTGYLSSYYPHEYFDTLSAAQLYAEQVQAEYAIDGIEITVKIEQA